MEAVPDCVLISVIAPTIMSSDITNTIEVILTCLAMMKFSLFPTVIISIIATGLLRAVF